MSKLIDKIYPMRTFRGIPLFIIPFTLIYALINFLPAFWLATHLPALPPWLGYTLFPVMAFVAPLWMLLMRRAAAPWCRIVTVLVHCWMGLAFIFFSFTATGYIFEWLAKPLSGITDVVRWTSMIIPPATLIAVILAISGGLRKPRIKNLEISCKNLPEALDGFKIAHLSDIHLGGAMPKSRIEFICDTLEEQKPDLLVFTGDLADPGFNDFDRLRRAAGKLNIPCGRYGVLGNHEYYFGIERAQTVFDAFGLTLLRNNHVTLKNGLQIAGIDDSQTSGIKREDVEKIFSALDPEKPSIFLTHQPRFFKLAATHGISLVLAGHTHNGQIFPFNLLVKLVHEQAYGLYQKDDTSLYITSGAGWWGPPMRLFTKSEIPIITLRPKK